MAPPDVPLPPLSLPSSFLSTFLANPFRVLPNPTLALCLTNFAADKQDNFLYPTFPSPAVHLGPTVARTVAQIINDARYRALFST